MILTWLRKKLFKRKSKFDGDFAIGVDSEGNTYFDLTDPKTAAAVMDQAIFFKDIELDK